MMNPKPPFIKGTVDCPKHGVTRTIWLAREDRPNEPLPCCIKCLAEAMVQPVRRSQESLRAQ